eukprot:87480-Rhodomonas_salina.1
MTRSGVSNLEQEVKAVQSSLCTELEPRVHTHQQCRSARLQHLRLDALHMQLDDANMTLHLCAETAEEQVCKRFIAQHCS